MDDKRWEELLKTRITPTTELEESRVLLSYNDCEIFAEGTMSCIVGAAKSRKTFCLSFLLEQMLNPTEPGFKSSGKVEVLYFDTEMSERRIQEVTQRFSFPNWITMLPIRQYSILERYNIIEEAIKRLKPSLVVIDGYKELTQDINDQVYSTKLTNKILQWTTEYGCHITGVLHTNPESSKPRGALGTEMINKCSLVAHVENKGPSSYCKPLYARDKYFRPFAFTINSEGRPQLKDIPRPPSDFN